MIFSENRFPLFGVLGEIDYPGFAGFRAPSEQQSVAAPRERRDRRVALFFGQYLNGVFDAHQ
jgi:hypothetical protein